MNPSILKQDSEEYFKLKIACQKFEELTEDMHFSINDIYFDAGQDWKWTTIVAYNDRKGDSWQALSPKDWNNLIFADTNAEIKNICKEIMKDYPNLWNLIEKWVVVNTEPHLDKKCQLIPVKTDNKLKDVTFRGWAFGEHIQEYSTRSIKYKANSEEDAKNWIEQHKDLLVNDL